MKKEKREEEVAVVVCVFFSLGFFSFFLSSFFLTSFFLLLLFPPSLPTPTKQKQKPSLSLRSTTT